MAGTGAGSLNVRAFMSGKEEKLIYIPTLSELIDACFKKEIKGFELTSWEGDRWLASASYFGKEYVSGTKDTADEAVAHLFLFITKPK